MNESNAAQTHGDEFFQALNKFRENDKFTDLTICVGQERLKVHRLVVASHSDFFRAMLTNGISEPEGEVTLKDIEPEAVKVIVDFWYTKQMEMTCENVCSILLVASRFQAKTALEVSTEFAEANLTTANCLGIAVLCERCNLTELGEKAFIFCLEHFEDIIQGTEVLDLDEDFLRKIISDDRLNVSGENHVLGLIIKWIEFDADLRSSKLEKLMGEVRSESIDTDSLIEITNLLAKASLLSKGIPDSLMKHGSDVKCNPRQPLSSLDREPRLYVIDGGYMCSYDPVADEWSDLQSPKERVGQNLAVAITNDCIYSLNTDQNCAQYYNLRTNSWSRGERLFYGPTGGFLVALAGCVYSFGKSSSDDHISSVLKYDLIKRSSTICAQIQEPRDSPGFAVHNHYIYVMGGTKIDSNHAMQSVERYNSREDYWESVAPMRNKRMSFGSCSWRGKIYVAGGLHCGKSLSMAEVYDPKLNTWTEIEPMKRLRANLGLVALMGQIFAVEGVNYPARYALDAVEAYNPDTNRWSEKKAMASSRYQHCTLVL